MQGLKLLVTKLFITTFFLGSSFGQLQAGEICNVKKNTCDKGLACSLCGPEAENPRTRCTATHLTLPHTKIDTMPFNRYSWLTTHNSFANMNARSVTDSVLLDPGYQEDDILDQLKNGVRGLNLALYDFNGDVWVCGRTNGSHCVASFAYKRAISVLNDTRTFLRGNPKEIVTLFIEDNTGSLESLLNQSKLDEFIMPKEIMDSIEDYYWPTYREMVDNNYRLLVFTSTTNTNVTRNSKFASRWSFMLETSYGDDVAVDSCEPRKESSPMAVVHPFIIMNHFPTHSSPSNACFNNSSPILIRKMTACYNQLLTWPNYIVVDYYKRSDGGGAFAAVDYANGQMICNGCPDIAYCEPFDVPNSNGTERNGTCLFQDIPLPAASPAPAPSEDSVNEEYENINSATTGPLLHFWLIIILFAIPLL